MSLIRNDITPARMLGFLRVDDFFECYTLERPIGGVVHAIGSGSFRVMLTPSGRAIRGTLWSPRNGHDLPEEDYALPILIGVPLRTSIRIHALNQVSETEGCIGVGKSHDTNEIHESRLALTILMGKMQVALDLGEEIWITVSTQGVNA